MGENTDLLLFLILGEKKDRRVAEEMIQLELN